MDRDDRIAQSLETGDDEALTPDQQLRVARQRAVLGEPSTWEELPASLEEDIAAAISAEQTPRNTAWPWLIAAALALVVGVVGVSVLMSDDTPAAVATVILAGTDLAPEASATAELIPTPNGWAIDFEAEGIPPAAPGTYYQAWVSNGTDGVSVGTFHMRGDEPTPIALWSGVDLREYATIGITVQEIGGGQESSGVLVLLGTAGEFDE